LPSVTICPFGCGGGTPVLGTAFIGPSISLPTPTTIFRTSVSVLKGTHSLKIGGEFHAYGRPMRKSLNKRKGPALISASIPKLLLWRLNDGKLLAGNPLSKLTFIEISPVSSRGRLAASPQD